MSNQDIVNQSSSQITEFFVPNEDKIRLLQSILETESGNPVSFEEAEEVGIQLITLYECLARDRAIISRSGDEKSRE